jgi:tRNA nucleotidyltransferase (CCA-adding enzyme)
MQVFLVGGAVRDALLGLPVRERDWVVVGGSAAELEVQGYTRVGHDFPVFLHPRTKEEHALARTERKRGRGYHGFEVDADPGVTLEQDLLRRDLTINAMALAQTDLAALESGDRAALARVVDPHGGRRDLAAKVLRHVSPAFVEDPLRVLRVARFAARFAPLGFAVAPETLALMRTIAASGELEALAPERVWTELARALGEPAPQAFVQVLRECGALVHLLPEVDRLFGVPQPVQHHPEIDSGLHTLMVLEQAARLTDDLEVRFAALVHDLGKGTTPDEMLPKHHGHEQRGARLVAALCERLKAPRACAELAELVARHHLIAHRALELRPSTALELLEHLDAFRRPQRAAQFVTACEADARGRTGREDAPYPQRARLEAAHAAARAVDARAVAEACAAEGIKGEGIAARLRAARVAAIADAWGVAAR